jgi:hypothetical protein
MNHAMQTESLAQAASIPDPVSLTGPPNNRELAFSQRQASTIDIGKNQTIWFSFRHR